MGSEMCIRDRVKLAVDVEDGEYVMSDDTWYVIRNTRGVTGFVGPESKPIPLSDEEVLALGVEKRQVEVAYQVGDLVNIIDGPFGDFSGVVEEIDPDKDLVRVTISMFGRETPVEFALDQVEPAVN